MSIIMIDSLPGIGKSNIMKKMALRNSAVVPYITNYQELSAFYEVYSGHQNHRISNAVLTLQLLILGNLADLVNQLEYAMKNISILAMEDSIFWPFVWIKTFRDLGYLRDVEHDLLIDILINVCHRFLDFTSSKGYKVVYEFVHVSNDKPYEFAPKYADLQCYHLQGRIFVEHSNFFDIVMKYFPAMKEFIRGLSVYAPDKHVFIFEHNNYLKTYGKPMEIREPEDLAQVFLSDLKEAVLTPAERYYDTFPATPDLLDFAYND